jgi:hypothetical protein
MASGPDVVPESREKLQKIVVRLLVIADRCTDLAIQYDLMLLAEELVKMIEDEIKA